MVSVCGDVGDEFLGGEGEEAGEGCRGGGGGEAGEEEVVGGYCIRDLWMPWFSGVCVWEGKMGKLGMRVMGGKGDIRWEHNHPSARGIPAV